MLKLRKGNIRLKWERERKKGTFKEVACSYLPKTPAESLWQHVSALASTWAKKRRQMVVPLQVLYLESR